MLGIFNKHSHQSWLPWIQRRFASLEGKYHIKKNDVQYVMTTAYALWLVQVGRFKITTKADAGALVGGLFTFYLYHTHSNKKIKQVALAKYLKTTPEAIDSVYNEWSMGRDAFLQRHAVVVSYHDCETFWTVEPMNPQETDPYSPFQLKMKAKVRKHLHLVKDSSQYALGKTGPGLDRIVFLPGWSSDLIKRKLQAVQAPRGFQDQQHAMQQQQAPPNVAMQGPAIVPKIYCTHSRFHK